MENTKVTFKIAMDAEQKALGNFKEVEFEVSFEGVSEELIKKHAIANQTVAWQSQIRSHWDSFVKGDLPKVVTFGQVLFGNGGRGGVVTVEKATTIYTASLSDLSREAKLEKLLEDGLISQEMFDTLIMQG